MNQFSGHKYLNEGNKYYSTLDDVNDHANSSNWQTYDTMFLYAGCLQLKHKYSAFFTGGWHFVDFLPGEAITGSRKQVSNAKVKGDRK